MSLASGGRRSAAQSQQNPSRLRFGCHPAAAVRNPASRRDVMRKGPALGPARQPSPTRPRPQHQARPIVEKDPPRGQQAISRTRRSRRRSHQCSSCPPQRRGRPPPRQRAADEPRRTHTQSTRSGTKPQHAKCHRRRCPGSTTSLFRANRPRRRTAPGNQAEQDDLSAGTCPAALVVFRQESAWGRWPAAVLQLILTVRDTRRRPGQHESAPPATRHEARHPASPIGRRLPQPTRQGDSGHEPNPPTYWRMGGYLAAPPG